MSLNKVVAALLAVVFVIFTLVVILAWSASRDVLNADAYIRALEEADFFEVPYQLIREGEIPTAGGLLLREGPLSVVSGSDLEAVARELAPPDWLRAQLERAIRDFVDVARDPERSGLPALVISLREVKARVLGESGDRALSIVGEALPTCGSDRLPLDPDSDTPICKPAGVDIQPFLVRLKSYLPPLVERVPDTYNVRWRSEQRDVIEDLQRAARLLDRLQLALLLLIALQVALLALIWVLAVRSPAEWLRWTGVPLLLLGLAVLLAAFLAPPAVAWGLEGRDIWAEVDMPTPLTRSLEEAVASFTPLLFRPALSAGLVLTSAGLLLTLVSPLFPGRWGRDGASPYGAGRRGSHSRPR